MMNRNRYIQEFVKLLQDLSWCTVVAAVLQKKQSFALAMLRVAGFKQVSIQPAQDGGNDEMLVVMVRRPRPFTLTAKDFAAAVTSRRGPKKG
jgi:hypothetical protein